MKKKLTALAVAAILAVTLTGCDSDENVEGDRERADRLYAECLEAGGSFEYNGSLPYFQCTMNPEEIDK